MGIKGFRTKVLPSKKEKELKALLDRWRESPQSGERAKVATSRVRQRGRCKLLKVKSTDIVPDSSNRMHTGLSLDHIHYIASNIHIHGFREHVAGATAAERRARGPPHDIPVLVRGSLNCPIATASLRIWRETVAGEVRYPPCRVNPSAFSHH